MVRYQVSGKCTPKSQQLIRFNTFPICYQDHLITAAVGRSKNSRQEESLSTGCLWYVNN